MEIAIAFCTGSLVLFGGAYVWWNHVEHRFTVVSPGEVYTSGAMPPGRLQHAVKRHGIQTVFDLRCPDEGSEKIKAEGEALREVGVTHVNLQSPQVPPDAIRNRFLTSVRDPENRPALIHCNHGQGRAVLFGALWRIEGEGWAPERARRACRLVTTRGSSFDLKKAKGAYLADYQMEKTS